MCPEFLREGSGVADFFDPPLVVVGTAQDDTRVRRVSRLFSFLDLPSTPASRPHRRGAQVRLQRLPRARSLVRERDRPRLPQASASTRAR